MDFHNSCMFTQVHILVFLCRNVFKGVNLDTFVPSWFVWHNGIMVSLVAGPDMLPSAMAKAVLYWGLFIYGDNSLHGMASDYP